MPIKKFVVMFACVLLPVLGGSAAADELKIGYIIVPRLLAETEIGKAAANEMRAKKNAMQEELDNKLSEIRDFVEDVRKRAMVLSATEKEKAGEEHERQLREAKRLQEDFQRTLQKAEADVMRKVNLRLQEAIETYGRENGYDLILDASILLHASGKADVTEAVIASANSAVATE
ncbi:MAG: OmpH family outer membrane protein [Deltaproteobacteria bacterium]